MSEAKLNVFLGAKTKEFNTKMGKASRTLKKLGKDISSFGSSMTRNFTFPIVAAGGASVKLAMDFQKSMTKIQTLVGKSDADIKEMTASVMELSGKTATAPQDLADGLYFLESAGLSGKNAMETLEQVAKGSASGLGDMESLAVVAAAAQNAYGEETLSAADALDKFGVMVQTGMFDAAELSNVLGKQLGLASSLGISFEEVGAMISTFTQTTGSATTATDAFGAVMMTFAKLDAEPTKQQAEALDAIGMSADQVNQMIAGQGLQATLMHLQTQFDANGVSMASFFGKSQSLKGVLGVLGNQTESYTNTLQEMNKEQEFVSNAFDKTASTDAGKMQQAMVDMQTAGTNLGIALTPVITLISEKITSLANWFNSLSADQKTNIANWMLWIAAIGPAALLIGKLTSGIGSFIGLLKKYNVVSKIATGVTKVFNMVMNANPLARIISIIALVISAFVYFANSTSNMAIKVRNFFKKMMNGVIGAINAIIAGINKYSKKLGISITPIKKFTMENEKSAEVVDDNAKSVENLGDELEKIPKTTNVDVNTNFNTNTGGDDDTSGDDDAAAERIKNEEAALENIRLLKQKFNVLNAEDEQKAALISLENQRKNDLLKVKEHDSSQAEIDAINKYYDKKKEKLLDKQQKDNEDAADATASKWEETLKKIEDGWKMVSSIANQVMNAIGGLMDARLNKEQQILDNKHTLENQDYEQWYERELQKIEQSSMNEEEKNKAIEDLDKVASDKKIQLEEDQNKETNAIKTKAAKADKKMKVMQAIMGTAQAVVNALGSAPPPFNFALAGLVAGLGAGQIAAISSTPIPAFADGGLVFGPTTALVGEYAGASSNPEVIAPLNKLKDIIGTSDEPKRIEVFGRLDGNDIFISNNLAETQRLRFT